MAPLGLATDEFWLREPSAQHCVSQPEVSVRKVVVYELLSLTASASAERSETLDPLRPIAVKPGFHSLRATAWGSRPYREPQMPHRHHICRHSGTGMAIPAPQTERCQLCHILSARRPIVEAAVQLITGPGPGCFMTAGTSGRIATKTARDHDWRP